MCRCYRRSCSCRGCHSRHTRRYNMRQGGLDAVVHHVANGARPVVIIIYIKQAGRGRRFCALPLRNPLHIAPKDGRLLECVRVVIPERAAAYSKRRLVGILLCVDDLWNKHRQVRSCALEVQNGSPIIGSSYACDNRRRARICVQSNRPQPAVQHPARRQLTRRSNTESLLPWLWDQTVGSVAAFT